MITKLMTGLQHLSTFHIEELKDFMPQFLIKHTKKEIQQKPF
jgi:hypothetical protein